jgi:hypothetical protein
MDNQKLTMIEKYKAAKRVLLRLADDVSRTLGRDDPSNDKHTFRCAFKCISPNDWSPMELTVNCSYGYYGNSSGHTATSEELGKYLALAINKHAAKLLDEVIALAAIDTETARKAAEAEARDVLAELQVSNATA